jgi:hypothetical protein
VLVPRRYKDAVIHWVVDLLHTYLDSDNHCSVECTEGTLYRVARFVCYVAMSTHYGQFAIPCSLDSEQLL